MSLPAPALHGDGEESRSAFNKHLAMNKHRNRNRERRGRETGLEGQKSAKHPAVVGRLRRPRLGRLPPTGSRASREGLEEESQEGRILNVESLRVG